VKPVSFTFAVTVLLCVEPFVGETNETFAPGAPTAFCAGDVLVSGDGGGFCELDC